MKKLSILMLATAMALPAFAQETLIQAEPLANNIHALHGEGGTMMLLQDSRNAYLIDTQFAPLSEKIERKIQELAPNKPLKYVINTHWHPDHVGGNRYFAEKGAIIIAQENNREAMSVPQTNIRGETVPAYAPSALPVLTYNDRFTLHADSSTMQMEHIPNAHSNGDAIVFMPTENVLHMGDIFFNHRFPNIDLSVKGSIHGMIKGTERGLALANEKTKVIAGHGKVGSRSDLQDYHKMLTTVAERVATAKKQGKTLAEIQASNPTQEWNNAYANALISPERFVELVYLSL